MRFQFAEVLTIFNQLVGVRNGARTVGALTSDDAIADARYSSAKQTVAKSFVDKKILIIVENLPVPFDRRVWQEACALRDNGAEVSVICPRGKNYEESYNYLEGIHIYRHSLPVDASNTFGYLREYSAALIWQMLLTWKIYFKHGIDVIHATNPPDFIFLVALPFKVLGVKFLYDQHDINPELYEAKFNRKDFFWQLLIMFERLTFFFADAVISTNESYRNIAMTRGRVPQERIFVVRSGPDLRRVRLMEPDPVWKNGRRFLVGYVGVMGDQEGIDLLLDAAAHLMHRRGRRDIQFVLAGDGPSRSKLERSAADQGLADYVRFIGRVPDMELFSMLSTADVCINPDRVNPMNNLSTMNKILEYMALSKPIVQFDVVEGRLSAGNASLYAKANDPIDFADKIIEFLNDANKRAKAGEIGRERIEAELAWPRQIPHLYAAYSSVLDPA